MTANSSNSSVPAPLSKRLFEFIYAWETRRKARHNPRTSIFHYCDANALLSIFAHKSVWASDTRFMNDWAEGISLLRNLPRIAKKYEESQAGRLLVKLSEVMTRGGGAQMLNTVGMSRYAASFSESGDVLSQWRSYANNGEGYAIGFDAPQLWCLGHTPPHAEICKMFYGGPEEEQQLDELFFGLIPIIEPYINILDVEGWNREAPAKMSLSLRLSESIANLAFESKDIGFQEEQEWRLYANDGPVKYRASRNLITPYRELPMRSSDNEAAMPIVEIVVGPRLNFRDAERGLIYLADEYGYGTPGFSIRRSTVPYR